MRTRKARPEDIPRAVELARRLDLDYPGMESDRLWVAEESTEIVGLVALKENPDCEIILMVMNPMVDIHSERRPELEKFNDIYRETANEKGFLLIDHYPSWLKILNAEKRKTAWCDGCPQERCTVMSREKR
ncbi:MAG: hypothetical protein NT006_01350 [Candidatus Aminicenantes bacterium]|nr:hypothetical protein [Candidatus Aminicenantes bacterium]